MVYQVITRDRLAYDAKNKKQMKLREERELKARQDALFKEAELKDQEASSHSTCLPKSFLDLNLLEGGACKAAKGNGSKGSGRGSLQHLLVGGGGFHIVEEGIMSYLFIRVHQRGGRVMKKKQRDRCVHCIFYDSSCCCEYELVFLTRWLQLVLPSHQSLQKMWRMWSP